MYRAQLKTTEEIITKETDAGLHSLEKLIADGMLMTASLYIFENQLFLYYECLSSEITPDALFPGLDGHLEYWPGGAKKRQWVPMIDIYHASQPQSGDHWRRQASVEERRGKLLRLKPEMLSSYVFYHFQLQEEKRQTDNKYCMIGLHENLLFHYDEIPMTEDVHPYTGKLDTANSPANWSEVMEPHFIYWEGVKKEDIRRYPMKPLFSI